MNILLIFFALPIATIIISIALQKILKCPPLVAAVIFAIFLIVTFAINNINFLVAAIVYAIIAFITAAIVCLICRLIERFCDNDNDNSNCGCGCNRRNGVTARVNVIPNTNSCGQISGCYRRR